VKVKGFLSFFYDFLGGHRLFNGHRLIDIDGSLGLGQIGQVGLVDLGVDEDIGRLALTTGLDVTRKLGVLTVGETPKNSGSDGHSLDIRIEDLKILESEALVEDQLEVSGGTADLSGLGGGGVHGGVSSVNVHYEINLSGFEAESSFFRSISEKTFG
jgi:hypothetical protein